MAKKVFTPEELWKEIFWDGNLGNSEQSCALICGAWIERCCEMLVRGLLLKGSTADELLSMNGTIGSVAQQIKLAYCLGLISKNSKKNAELIQQIRNRFAHSHSAMSFSDAEIAKWCGKLIQPNSIDDQGISAIVEETTKGPQRNLVTATLSLAVHMIHTSQMTVQVKLTENPDPRFIY